jgi:predicted nucleic-acid-binding protein
MRAVDTNVLVRLLTDDDPAQAHIVRALFEMETVWIAKTVWLETRWVLKSAYGFEDSRIGAAFAGILGLPNVISEDESGVIEALRLMDREIDFADALHLTSTPPDAKFVTFDRTLIRRAKRAGSRVAASALGA